MRRWTRRQTQGTAARDRPIAGARTLALSSTRHVRSGQSVFFADGDVTVVGSVGSGAEVVAGGSIHVYGTLRGRAMAGTSGNSRARIFCRRIEAELLAIDGFYRTADQLDPQPARAGRSRPGSRARH